MKTTKRHFGMFERYCRKWAYKFGLTDWELFFYWGSNEENYAETSWDAESRNVTFCFANDWGEIQTLNAKAINETARHEVLHLLVGTIHEMIYKKKQPPRKDIEEAVHATIRRIEHYIDN